MDNGETILIQDCRIDTIETVGIYIKLCKNAVIKNSKILNCRNSKSDEEGTGIAITDKSVATITSCTISTCVEGIEFCLGKCTTVVNNCTITKNYGMGIFIGPMCTGSITLNANIITMNPHGNIKNEGLAKCKVMMDGQALPNSGFMANTPQAVQDVLYEQSVQSTGFPLRAQRKMKEAGLLSLAPSCNKCKVKEPNNVKFQKCSRCMRVVYCSKDCQRVDWAEHRHTCSL
jgi:hypothetical protein